MTDYAGFSTRYIGEYQTALRIELSDAATFFSNNELNRGIHKAVALMSRLIPKRAIVETLLDRSITGTLTISSSTGTLTYKPIKPGSLVITGKVENTDYTVNYLTGVVTEVGALLPDAAYTVTYELDPHILDISSLLTDYIRIERVEYPVGESPPTFVTIAQEIFATYLSFKEVLEDEDHLRITYLTNWSAPGDSTAPDYPKSLDNAIVIGGAGEALIFKAEKYVQSAIDALAALTAPTVYTLSKASSPGMPAAPIVPTTLTLSFTAVGTALTAIGTEITAAKAHITSGAALVNTANKGQNVAENYGEYAKAVFGAANTRVQEALANLRQIEESLALYASDVTSYGSQVNAYANNISGLVGIFRGQSEAETTGIENFRSQVERFVAQTNEQQMKATNFLAIAGRYLASGQAKINEMLTMLGLKAEYNMYKSSSEQFS